MNNSIQDKEFTSKQIEQYVGIKANTLHYYIQSEAIIPDVDEGSGTGTRRIFSGTNYFEACIIKQLMDYGLPKKSIVQMMKSVRDSGDRHFLNPDRFLKSDSDNIRGEFLVFLPQEKGFTHRFIKHGGEAYRKSHSQWKAMRDKTSNDE